MRIRARTATLVLATTMTGLLLVPSFATAAIGDITEWALPTLSTGPQGIAAGTDGSLWFAERGADRIGRITTAGVVTEFPLQAGTGPTSIALGPDGAMWFTQEQADRIGRIDVNGAVTEYPVLTSSSAPMGIAAGPDGAMWFTEQAANVIGRIDMSGAVTEYAITTRTGSGPTGIAAGPDGAMWFTERTAGRIGRIDMDGLVTDYALPTGGGRPTGIALGPDGAMWFTAPGTNMVGRITTAGFANEMLVPTPNSDPLGITAGPDGAMWFTERSGDRVTRVGSDGAMVEYPLPTEFAGPHGIAAGPDGNLWFTESAVSAIGRLELVEADATPPVVTIVEPTADSVHMVGDVVLASYACTDSGGGLPSCVGTVPSGSPLDTSTPGIHVFEVTAIDGAGHSTTVTLAYLVLASYDGRLLLPPEVATLRAGQPADVRFGAGAGLVLEAGAPFTEPVDCGTWAPTGPIETATGTGQGAHMTGDLLTFRWRTEKAWAGTCRSLLVPFSGGVTLRFLARFV